MTVTDDAVDITPLVHLEKGEIICHAKPFNYSPAALADSKLSTVLQSRAESLAIELETVTPPTGDVMLFEYKHTLTTLCKRQSSCHPSRT
jgi:hypothetical protein